MIRNLIFLLAFFGSFTQYAQEKSKGMERTSTVGLLIDNSIRRGTGYTDSLGSNYNLRYIPIAITNDSTISMHLRIAFSDEYSHQPGPDVNEKFKIVLLPREWALNGVGITESMMDELPGHIEKPLLIETIEPGEKFIMAIGTLYDNSPYCGIVPNVLFLQGETNNFQQCDSRMNQDKSTNPQLTLGLQLDFCGGGCILMPCGQISF